MNRQRGVTLIEVLVYVALFALLFGLVIGVIMNLLDTYKQALKYRAVSNAAITAMERIVREVREADTIEAGTVLVSSPGEIEVSSLIDDIPRNVHFEVDLQNRLTVSVNAGMPEPLTGEGVIIDEFRVYDISTTTVGALRVFLRMRSEYQEDPISIDLSGTATLRNSYR